ncbi:MAG: hypothetical protein HY644_06525 [Acidobacteria bacterium]|nr:hypothetical protein [Acidobacteriota bacterium]
MVLVQRLEDVLLDAVRFQRELTAIPTRYNANVSLTEKSSRTDFPQDGTTREALAGLVFQIRKLRRDIRRLQDAIYHQWKSLQPGTSVDQERQLFFIHTFVDYLDWTVKPLDEHLTQIQRARGEVFSQIDCADLQWHIDQLNEILPAIQSGIWGCKIQIDLHRS